MKVPAWPFLLGSPLGAVGGVVALLAYAPPAWYAWVVGFALLFFGVFLNASLVLLSTEDGIRVPLPTLPRRRTRQERRIEELEARRLEVLAERDALPENHANRKALDHLHDVLAGAVEGEIEDLRNGRFVKVTRRANRALDGKP